MTKYLVEADLTRDGAYAWVGGVLIDAKHLTPVVPEAEAVLSEAVEWYHRVKPSYMDKSIHETPLFKATEAYVKATTPANPAADSVARVEAAWGGGNPFAKQRRYIFIHCFYGYEKRARRA